MLNLDKMGLRRNPFEPAATGAPPTGTELSLPASWQRGLELLLDRLQGGKGVKALTVWGEYGCGKTYILQWLHRQALPQRVIRPFYFDNPGIQFYDLANALLRQVGRKDFVKSLWELASLHVKGPFQRHLFSEGFEEYLIGVNRGRKSNIGLDLQSAILAAGITRDEEIAARLCRMVEETPVKPYFDYQDFASGRRTALVAEKEEAPYFSAILATLRLAAGIDAVCFLIDEFEEVSLGQRLTRREAHDYLATLTRLINLAAQENLWLIVSMTPDALDRTRALEPKLWERFTGDGDFSFHVPPLSQEEAAEFVLKRLEGAREGTPHAGDMYPFPENLVRILRPSTVSNPRRLVKVCFFAMASADDDAGLPLSRHHIKHAEESAYPSDKGEAE